MMSHPDPGPAMLRYIESTLGSLRDAGFSIAGADHAWNAMDSYIYGFTLQELNYPFDPGQVKETAAAYLPLIPVAQFPRLAELTEHIARTAYKSAGKGAHDFEFGLNLILDGLDKILLLQKKK